MAVTVGGTAVPIRADLLDPQDLPRLVEELWGMHFMSTRNKHARDGSAGSLLGAFDFHQPPRAPMLLNPRATCP